MTASCDFGVSGLAVMGQNLARNAARRGITVAVHNRTAARTEAFMAEFGREGPLSAAASVAEFVALLRRPRRVMLMVKAGAPVDAVIEELLPHLEPGDVVIDGGNSHYLDTVRRGRALAGRGVHLLGTGVSGGELGALVGPSLMPGGPAEAYAVAEGVLAAIAARVDGGPACALMGPDGAGHYVKMVHNGIEYAFMQLIAEAYDLLRHGLGLPVEGIAAAFAGWNAGPLESYLVEITARVLGRVEPDGRPLVDSILDRAEQKGTGRWTVQDALELGVPATTISEAVFARSLSAFGAERAAAARALVGPRPDPAGLGLGEGFVDDVRDALYAAEVVAYAQGFMLLAAASRERGWSLDLASVARVWRGGSIVRARLLGRVAEAFAAEPAPASLLLVPELRDAVGAAQGAWRRVVGAAVGAGIAAPAFSSALAFYDGYRRERGPTSVIQGLRDLFGAHSYRRLDRPGVFHTLWDEDGREVQVS